MRLCVNIGLHGSRGSWNRDECSIEVLLMKPTYDDVQVLDLGSESVFEYLGNCCLIIFMCRRRVVKRMTNRFKESSEANSVFGTLK